MGVKLLTVL